ncbi:Fumarylacetoacetate (FAA) hydrolase family protein [Pirellula sp. SH-Sr6A]|uniref:fumarylacetoacetate hydrolase family protein n=1 Tax=Pirellula sp. SH-Sr6A TaxID=1632865 RepID=UPI00078B3F0E|nr:fumarylacetoacetate hydrolase family protein [Pirellula sp. SH-Sr6A]AMV34901.1 Fumarylacetoacetate (FAA) hydrolase family protein [Pirellula sp. SH-Sr6A]
MKLGRIQIGSDVAVVRIQNNLAAVLDLGAAGLTTLQDLLSSPDLERLAVELPTPGDAMKLDSLCWLPPIDQQEVWAAGVTYKRSQTARMEESEAAASCYDRVYTAARPEIFFKATPNRCSGHLGKLRIRTDATWNVPEPELALVISRVGKIVAYTIGNDMSSRDIEGDNPLYLPQAKVYNECCGLGPWVTLASAMPERSTIGIRLEIHRDGAQVFTGETGVSQMARNLEDLVSWLLRDNDMPNGAFLLTGTGIVPDSSFTLAPGDRVHISIDGIGTLSNVIVQG